MRRASATALGLVALVAGGSGGYLVGTRHSDTTTVASAPVKLSTAKVQQLDLVTYDETTATLGFTTSATVSSPVAGTVTSIVAGGDTVDAGTVVATVDGAPVVAMIGDIPTYRDLSTASSNGADIRQLELNLVQLGFDPDHKIVIDEKYDTATKDAVTAWEDSLGLTGDGQITKGELVFIPGRLLVDTVSATVGGSVNAGSALVVGRQAERKYFVAGLAGATIDKQAAAGTQGDDRNRPLLEQRAAGHRGRGRCHGDTGSVESTVRRCHRRRGREAVRTGVDHAWFQCRRGDDRRRPLRRRHCNRDRRVVGVARGRRQTRPAS